MQMEMPDATDAVPDYQPTPVPVPHSDAGTSSAGSSLDSGIVSDL